MEYLNAVQAARHLGVVERTVRNMVGRGELEVVSADPVRFDPRHVAEVLRVRQASARLELMRLRKDPLSVARETRALLDRPYSDVNLPQYRAEDRKRRMALVSQPVKTLFGTAALAAAQSEDGSCRWCKAAEYGRFLGAWAPTAFSPEFRALFGADPCEACGPALYGTTMRALAARVHPGGERPSAGRTEPPAPRMRAEARQPVREAPAVAQPVQADDGGRAAVARRRREVQAKLKAANRAGDTAYGEQLARQLEVLRADAAVVDGRASTRRLAGFLRCGHALAAGCSCPRIASKRATP